MTSSAKTGTINCSGLGFDLDLPSGGYAWWYVDAVSEDGQHALVLIAFVGSVFSPYYAWSRQAKASNHCALNVALYGAPARWAMTERPEKRVTRSASEFKLADSHIRLDQNELVFDISEYGAPLPLPIRGQVRVKLPYQNQKTFPLDAKGEHIWRPICAHAEVKVVCTAPQLNWSGEGYLDMNIGQTPIADAFEFWDWARTPLHNHDRLIRYVTDPVSSARRDLAIQIGSSGEIEPVASQPDCSVASTPIWQIKRRAGRVNGQAPKVLRTFEDTPFYSRSLLSYPDGVAGPTVHETLSGRRLRKNMVKALLPFRMPRWPL